VKSVSIPVREKGLRWEGFVEKVGFEPDVKERERVMVNESGELMEKEMKEPGRKILR